MSQGGIKRQESWVYYWLLPPLEHINLSDKVEKMEIAGPGFLNIHLKSERIASQIEKALSSANSGVEQKENSQTIVIDYLGPNLAKEMHVGHLRSTIIGDAMARILTFIGHKGLIFWLKYKVCCFINSATVTARSIDNILKKYELFCRKLFTFNCPFIFSSNHT